MERKKVGKGEELEEKELKEAKEENERVGKLEATLLWEGLEAEENED